MVMFIIGVIIVLVCAGYTCYREESVGMGFVGGLIAIVAYFSIWFIASVIFTYTAPLNDEYMPANKIYALQDNSAISGHFFLGCGSFDEEMKYVYLEENEYGIHMETVPVIYAYVNETDTEDPNIKTIEAKYKDKFLQKNFACLEDCKYIITIPAGSIKYDFNIDLKGE
jgi:hypothetical protein